MYDHKFVPANPGDSRAPCPALNALANHGYLPHSGRDIGLLQLIHALRHVYNLSLPFAFMLSFVGILLCGHGFFRLDLQGLAAHNRIEHDGSLAHGDAAPGNRFAPIPVNKSMFHTFLVYAALGQGIYLEDFMRARVDREAQLQKPLDSLRAQIGQGEAALAWLVMRDDDGKIPLGWLEQWWGEERLPDTWTKPHRVVGILEARTKANVVADGMAKLRLQDQFRRKC
ncbi:hypothetical protein PILCRDRAFT_60618 [Piloderma croceum F 1598]|uniref:Heme haloperoxidase family profile domain-containing protein n=1 Tax=Piloderma croceum (strain F 1598) TaxID=765440 RepID=A0A0C3GGT6_PILCF|nr:hypothetical protein PILCRDRAFT_60618 [Piloderma croceum F 1598]